MKRTVAILFLLLILCTATVHAQGANYEYQNLTFDPVPPAVLPYPVNTWNPAPQAVNNSVTGWGLTVIPYGRLGYQRLLYELNVPLLNTLITNQFGDQQSLFDMQSLNLTMEDVNLFSGSVGFEARMASGFGAYFHFGGSIPRDITIETELTGDYAGTVQAPGTSENPMFESPLQWDGEKLGHWYLDGGVSYSILSWLDMMAGFRAEHVDISLRNPRNSEGNIPFFPGDLPAGLSIEVDSDNTFGELITKLWIPYLGIGARTSNYKWNLIMSPVMATSTEVPFIINTNWLLTVDVPGFFLEETLTDLSSSAYTVDLTGGFSIVGNFEYGINLTPWIIAGAWVEGRWAHIQGIGEMSANKPLEDIAFLRGLSGNDQASGSYITKASFSTGLALNAVF